jgi:NTP pyrophosphatase (non-canonical NTP hydrolase)
MTKERDTSSMEIARLQRELQEFADARDWHQFHSPKNLAMALAAESGELLEVFQWLTEANSASLTGTDLSEAASELADIQIYLLRLADILGVSLPDAVEAKMRENARRYPIDQVRGKATKRARLEESP